MCTEYEVDMSKKVQMEGRRMEGWKDERTHTKGAKNGVILQCPTGHLWNTIKKLSCYAVTVCIHTATFDSHYFVAAERLIGRAKQSREHIHFRSNFTNKLASRVSPV